MSPLLKKTIIGATMLSVTSVGVFATAPSANAAYPQALVRVGANVRNKPNQYSHSDGTVAGPGDYQVSDVKCWKDGWWALGEYWTNRWFIVYVDVTGINGPQWEFVHASFVKNQPSVRECQEGKDY